MNRACTWGSWAVWAVLTSSLFAEVTDAPPTSSSINFLRDVRPILREHCYECHAGEVAEGGFNLSIGKRALAGGDSGLAIVRGDAAKSLLIQLISGEDADRRMPPEDQTPLSPEEIRTLRTWVEQGASWPEEGDVQDPRLERASKHWAFARLQPVKVPARDQAPWSQTAIDRFVEAQFAEQGLRPAPPAAPRTLLRRLYFDVVGLPPTPTQTARFLADYKVDSQQATAALIEELLASPHFGERWGRHWLDVARYADSDGQESDRDRPHAYHYRDFVIEALNEDMPYDQFVRWQIAGDEYEPESDRAVSATGFLAAGPSMKLKDSFLERERLFNRYNELDDIISTVGTGLLGLTVGCARCHDHKYDAFSAREYYQLLGVFHSGDRAAAKLPSGADGFFFQDFDQEVKPTWLFRRSDFYDREIEVGLGFPQVVSAGRPAAEYWEAAKVAVAQPRSTLQRRAFADWITDIDQGGGALLARVVVNRIWQQHFGQGLVRTPSDFGVRGDAPTHPQLLEFLAADLVQHGWKMKRLHRQILRSAVWQQASTLSEGGTLLTEQHAHDPQNTYLARKVPQRLEAEVLRDAMLAVSGTLNLQAGGPGFKPYIPPEANLARNIQGGDYPKDAPDDASTRRRSVYMFHKRLVPYPLFQAFDRPELMRHCAQRQNTTVAPQAMALLNDRFVRRVAVDFARRLLEQSEADADMVEASFQWCFARAPTEHEMQAAQAFLAAQRSARDDRDADAQAAESTTSLEAVADYCQALFSLNEFLYID